MGYETVTQKEIIGSGDGLLTKERQSITTTTNYKRENQKYKGSNRKFYTQDRENRIQVAQTSSPNESYFAVDFIREE